MGNAKVDPHGIGTGLVETLIIQWLVNNEQAMLGWVEAGEGALYEALVKAVGSKSAAVGALLEQWKTFVLGKVDGLDQVVLDQIIAALKGTAG